MTQEKPPRRPHPLERPYGQTGPGDPNTPQQPAGEQIVFNMEQREPRITYILIGINVFIFALGFLLPSLGNLLLEWGWNFAPAIFIGNEYYRLFTSMFLHGGLAHIFFNGYALYILGTQTEQLYGNTRYLVIYFLGGVTGSVLSAAFGDPRVPSVGASGAVFALLGAQMIFLFRYRDRLGNYGRSALQQYLFLTGINLVLGFTVASIDNLGHLGGLLGGVVLGWLLAPVVTTREGEQMGRRIIVVNFDFPQNTVPISTLYALVLVAALAVVGFVLF